MADKSELRMNLAAIKRVDPYAKDIVDSSAHVAFYTFNSDDTEWEKTDVEGAFFVYSRNAEPFNSVFINNRLNTNSLVEPITAHIELQSQPPFLLYRNERSRIRGFWFYNRAECGRIGELVERLIKECGNKNSSGSDATGGINCSGSGNGNNSISAIGPITNPEPLVSKPIDMLRHSGSNVDIFSMLSKAQQDFNNSLTTTTLGNSSGSDRPLLIAPAGSLSIPIPTDGTSQSVMNFFAAAKPAKEVPHFHRMLSAPVHVDQIEKQHRVQTPLQDKSSPPQLTGLTPHILQRNTAPITYAKAPASGPNENGFSFVRINSPNQQQQQVELGTSPLPTTSQRQFSDVLSQGSLVQGEAKVTVAASISGGEKLQQKLKSHPPTEAISFESMTQPLQKLLKKPSANLPSLNSNNINIIDNNINNNTVNTTPGKPALMPPTMFKSTATPTQVSINNGSKSFAGVNKKEQKIQKSVLSNVGHSAGITKEVPSSSKPEPLTQTQLLQAMSYLIKNDPDFVRKLHEAYLKSFTEMVSL